MIEAGLGWKFRDHIADRILFEDQVVEHVITGHLARRRVYPERLSKDEDALNLIKRQIAASAKVEHPGFQRLFLAGDSGGYFTVIGELNDAPSLAIAADRKLHAKPRDWHAFSLRFAKFCIEMQRLRIALDRLNLDDIQFHRNMFQVSSRFPVGLVNEAVVLGSPYLQRLMDSPVGGAYVTDKGEYPLDPSMRKIKEILFTIASGQTARDVQQMIEYRQESARTTGSKQYTVLGLEPVIENLILRMHEPADTHPIRNFDQLLLALESIPEEELQGSSQSGSLGSSGSHPSGSAAISGTPSSGSVAHSRPVPPPASRTESGPGEARPQSAPRAYSPTGKSEISMSSRDRQKEDEEEDRSYLYPQRDTIKPKGKGKNAGAPAPVADPSTGPKADPSTGSLYSPGSPSIPTKRRRGPGAGAIAGVLAKLVGAVVVLGAFGAGGWYVWSSMQAPPPNEPPVAVLEIELDEYEVNQLFSLIGENSSDPDGNELRYNWTVRWLADGEPGADLKPGEHLLEDNGKSAKLRIFQVGTYEVELKVFDGRSYSDPAVETIKIYGSG